MNTIYFTDPTTENIAAAADIIRRGGLLGIPTETVTAKTSPKAPIASPNVSGPAR